jgi:hypothetical protein
LKSEALRGPEDLLVFEDEQAVKRSELAERDSELSECSAFGLPYENKADRVGLRLWQNVSCSLPCCACCTIVCLILFSLCAIDRSL